MLGRRKVLNVQRTAWTFSKDDVIRMIQRIPLDELYAREVLPVLHGLLEQRFVRTAKVPVDLVGNHAVVPNAVFLSGRGPRHSMMRHLRHVDRLQSDFVFDWQQIHRLDVMLTVLVSPLQRFMLDMTFGWGLRSSQQLVPQSRHPRLVLFLVVGFFDFLVSALPTVSVPFLNISASIENLNIVEVATVAAGVAENVWQR